MSPRLEAAITADGRIACTLLAGGITPLADPVLGLSLMAPGEVVAGGKFVASTGGFLKLRLDGVLSDGAPLRFTLAYRGYRAVNRAWLPQGVFLDTPEGPVAVQGPPAGAALAQPGGPVVAPPAGLGLVPPPQSWQPQLGQMQLSALAVPQDAAFADRLGAADALALRIGQPPLIAADGVPVQIVEDSALPAEAYRLTLAGSVEIRAGGPAGAFHAAMSLIFLRAVHRRTGLPRGVIEDAPRFAWRGQHLDCARHFFRPVTITRLLDLMALLKMNRFHWHFADDEAFRLEVDCAPEIWRETAMRGEGRPIPGVFGGGAGPTGGHYTKAAARDILAHADALGIEVLPEIEVPAHALCLTRVRPGLREPGDTGCEVSVQGYRGNVVNPALPATWDFLLPLAAEVADLFPFRHLHIGGDELPPGTWQGAPAVAALSRRLRFTEPRDVQGYTMHRLAAALRDHGVTPCAWEEAALGCQGGIGHDAVLFSWTGQGPGVAAARRGHPVVMCPAQHVYLDMAHTGDTRDWGAAWAAFVDLGDTVDWDPVPADAPEIAHNILGVQGAFWAEFTTEDAQIEPMLAPRMLGVASRAWSPPGRPDRAEIDALARGAAPVFDAMGWSRYQV
ncbi:MAG: beta-N-acetylhexosaminidase [Pseudomonadota bacterium]